MTREPFPVHRQLFVVIAATILAACGPLTPAGNLEGTWTSPFATQIYYATNNCGYPAVAEAVATRNVTWTITSTGDNSVQIDESFSESVARISNSCNSNLYIADVSGATYFGNISATTLTVTGAEVPGSTFSFTNNPGNLTGTWNAQFCGIYCNYSFSKPRAFILTR